MLQNSGVVVVSGWQEAGATALPSTSSISAVTVEGMGGTRDRLWNKTHFMERALLHSNFLDPVSIIADHVPEVPCVHVSDTLDRVILSMVVSGYEEVCYAFTPQLVVHRRCSLSHQG